MRLRKNTFHVIESITYYRKQRIIVAVFIHYKEDVRSVMQILQSFDQGLGVRDGYIRYQQSSVVIR